MTRNSTGKETKSESKRDEEREEESKKKRKRTRAEILDDLDWVLASEPAQMIGTN